MHPNCFVSGAHSTPDQMDLLEYPILELRLSLSEKYLGSGACISPTRGAQGCSSAASLEKLIFLFSDLPPPSSLSPPQDTCLFYSEQQMHPKCMPGKQIPNTASEPACGRET